MPTSTFAQMLQLEGHEVLTSQNALLALDETTRFLPDAIIVDLHMPNMNGLELQARIAASGLHVPVILITAHDEPTLRARSLTAGAIGYLTKPFPDEVLLDVVAGAISGLDHSANNS